MTRVRPGTWIRSIAIAYATAVERDTERAHPIQSAGLCFPAALVRRRFVGTAKGLYRYSIFLYDERGSPVAGKDAISVARWLLFEDIYIRGAYGCFPTNARIDLANRAGFREESGRVSQKVALDLWANVVALWGPPQREGNVEGLPLELGIPFGGPA